MKQPVPILVLSLLIGLAAPALAQTTVAGGLNGPMGVLVAPDGSVWVIDSGMGGSDMEITAFFPAAGGEITATIGDSARVVQITPDGVQRVAAQLPSMLQGQEAAGGARLALLNGSLYATSSFWVEFAGPEAPPLMAQIVKIAGNQVIPVADLWTFERLANPDGFIREAHPYSLLAGPDGHLWLTDAGANTLLRVDPGTGAIELIATFAGLPSPLPNPARGNAMESDPVPTGVAVDADGNVMVSLLPGFPFLPGSARVVMVSPDGSANDYATGLTALTDLRLGPDGNLYAVQFAVFSEQGPAPGSGALVRIGVGDTSVPVLEGLSFPTSVAFNAQGDAFVTINGVGAPGSGAVVRYDGVAAP